VQAQFPGRVLDEVAVAHALHTSGHIKAPCVKFLVHGSWKIDTENPAILFAAAICPAICDTLAVYRGPRAAHSRGSRIQLIMKSHRFYLKTILARTAIFLVLAFFVCVTALPLSAQENGPGPLTPPPEHKVQRVVGVPEAEAPPSLPPAQIIKAFAQKEELYLGTRPQYAYRKSIRIQEFGPDGRPSGEYDATYDAVRSSDGKLYEKAIAAPESTLVYLQFEPEDAQLLTRLPEFPVTPAQIAKYDLQYLSTEKVDEVDCYIFQVHPKTLDRQHPLFDGILWVDQKYLEVVKTYGNWVTDLGPMHPPTLPFGLFETYRENVDGKYWFPDYARSESVYKLKDHDVPIRVTIKWTDFKPFPAVSVPVTQTAAPPASAPQPAKP
jgi:hypothetical protein